MNMQRIDGGEYISKAEFLRHIERYKTGDKLEQALYSFAYKEINACKVINAKPEIMGKWVWHPKDLLQMDPYQCSICKEQFKHKTNYCSNCGSKME